jgi:RimJ/RimL family protein N-acetyltransferase
MVLVAGVRDDNVRSSRVLLKCGFVQVNSLENAYAVLGQPAKIMEGMATLEEHQKWYRYERRPSVITIQNDL